ncbi:uncharacterized protein HMPREF1541_09323 [Cyphellophora europaea CBS 101466]|uniref:Uncharacterized protein n=1 Tax=Cyphellophora europaea (strain CBS 101466) TaxID=1220924 RepID=W2S9U2_CYPE1|nr:uncharacterized protein HMPREF1541_09323 [Cyphellophora europaea CBS 101466]ETN45491.1 hypothetical protein HMPREF1541_09323 [Cyphellophora europaea CBS 101466]
MDQQTSGRKNGKNAKPVHWTAAGVLAVLTFIDNNKGENSPFLGKQQDVLQRIRDSLSNAFTNDDFGRLRKESVRDKITHIWKSCKKNEYDGIKNLWTYGTTALDAIKFNAEYSDVNFVVGGDSSDMPNIDNAKKSTSPDGVKRKRSHEDNDRAQQRAPKKQRITRRDSGLAMDNNTKSSRSTTARPSSATIDVDEEIAADLLRERDENGNEIVPDSEDDSQSNDAQQSDDDDFEDSPLHMFPVRPKPVTTVCTQEELKMRSSEMVEMIDKAVDVYMASLGFPRSQPICLDLEATFPPDMQPLFARMVGTTGAAVKDWVLTKGALEKLMSSDNYDRIDLKIFLRGLIGAALQVWCFEPFRGSRYWDDGIAISQMARDILRASTDPRDFETYRQKVNGKFIMSVFLPETGGIAQKQAKRFDQMLAFVLPTRKPAVANYEDHIFGSEASKRSQGPEVLIQGQLSQEVPTNRFENTNSTQVDESRQPILSTEAQEEWVEALAEIFQKGLVMRALMDMPYDSKNLSEKKYTFSFPVYHQAVDAQDMWGRVIVGFFPTIESTEMHKTFNEGGYSIEEGETVELVKGMARTANIGVSSAPKSTDLGKRTVASC